jgi:hypothetical protein
MKRISSPKFVIIIAAIIGLLIIGYAVSAYAPAADERDPGASNTSNEPQQTVKSYTGELVCLPHAGNPEVTTMECAFGIKQADGIYYALRSDDADPAYMTMPTGTSITVKGVFEKNKTTTYDTVGVIAVTDVEKAE